MADLVAFGVAREAAEAAYGRVSGTFGLLPDVAPAVWFFLRLRLCWRFTEKGSWIGLDWTQAAAKLGLLGLGRQERAEMLERLELMEDAALAVLQAK